MKTKRILWILNHETLREFEVPLLHDWGFELFLPKIYPQNETFSSGSIDDHYDQYLTIPPDDLELLNKHDFYNSPLPPHIIRIINDHFEIAFIFPLEIIITEITRHFKGAIFLHAFGSFGSYPFSRNFQSEQHKIFQIQNRFYFAQSYPFLSEIEDKLFQYRAVYLPIGMSKSMLKLQDTWTGGNQKLVFVCPRIHSTPYYQKVYSNFKTHFADVPHVIAGRQFYPHSDSAIIGSLPTDAYRALMQQSEVMFYHLEEPYLVHLHPIEALVLGLPLIYMHKGVLGRLANNEQLPGSCETILEAKEKVQRIMDKDQDFILQVITSQKKLLESFLPENCERVWRNNFLPIVQNKHPSIYRTLSKREFYPDFIPQALWQIPKKRLKNAIKKYSITRKTFNRLWKIKNYFKETPFRGI